MEPLQLQTSSEISGKFLHSIENTLCLFLLKDKRRRKKFMKSVLSEYMAREQFIIPQQPSLLREQTNAQPAISEHYPHP